MKIRTRHMILLLMLVQGVNFFMFGALWVRWGFQNQWTWYTFLLGSACIIFTYPAIALPDQEEYDAKLWTFDDIRLPVVVNKDMEVISGNNRVDAFKGVHDVARGVVTDGEQNPPNIP